MSDTERCEQEIIRAFEIARAKLGIVMDIPRIRWDLRGTTAGKADIRHGIILLNPVLMQDNTERFIDRTPAHEAAHFIAFRTNPADRPHGNTWQKVMWALGKPATRCHSYDTSTVTGRKPKSVCTEIA